MADPVDRHSRNAADSPSEPLVRDFTLATLVALRHEVEEFAATQGLAEHDLYRFVVAVNELTTNAVRHGGGAGRLELRRSGDTLHCCVSDMGPGIPADQYHDTALPRPHAVNGRGLWLARHNADSFDIDSRAVGTSISLTTRVA